MIYTLPDKPPPSIADSCYIAPNAEIIGWVELGEQASVWFNSVLRGDNECITVGARSNIQDGSVLHTDPGMPIIIEQQVTVGHSVCLHGCHIQSGSLIGIGSVILNGAIIGRNCLVGARSLITENQHFPDGCLILGSPAKVVRELSDEEIVQVQQSHLAYVDKLSRYQQLTEIAL